MSEWRETNLDEIVKFQRGHDLTVANILEGNYPVAGSNGIIGYHNQFTTMAPGITLGRSGNSIGVAHYYDRNFWAHNTTLYTTEFLNSWPKYVFYFLRTLDFSALNSGSAVPSLNRNHIHSIKVKIPDLPEQKAIASVLSSLDDKIDLLHRQNKTLEAMAETLFRRWFVEEAQEDWEEKKLADYADHLKINITPANNPVQIYTHYSLLAFDDGMKPVVEIGSEILSNKYSVEPWTILVSKLNPHFPRIWPIGGGPDENAICSTEFQVFKPKDEKLYGYLYFLLKSDDVREELTMSASGTSGSHQRVRPGDILNLKIMLPSTNLAEQYSESVMTSIKKMMANLEQIRTLQALRDTILPKLMSGEVRVALQED